LGRGQAIQTQTKTNRYRAADSKPLNSLLGAFLNQGFGTCGGALGACWFWFVFGSLAPFPTALSNSVCVNSACRLPKCAALHKKRKSLARKCEDGSDPVYRSLEIELDKSPKQKFGNVQVRTIHLVPFPNALGFFFVFTRFAKSGFK